jgi:hypothetical protein
MRLRRLALCAILMPAALTAQSVCKPGSGTNEAKLLAFFAGPLGFSYVPGVSGVGLGNVAVAGELALLPKPPSAITHSSGVCGFNKSENADLAPVFPRPRVAVGIGGGVVVEASWLPPVTVMDATPHLSGFALSWTMGAALPFASAHLTLRAHTTLGDVEGPITCPKKYLQTTSTNQPCYGSTPSKDRYEPNVSGVEAVAHARLTKLGWHVGVGVNNLYSRLKVNFADGRGSAFDDHNVVQINLSRVAVLGGVTWDAMPKLSLAAQVYSVPSDATTGRLGLAWRLR